MVTVTIWWAWLLVVFRLYLLPDPRKYFWVPLRRRLPDPVLPILHQACTRFGGILVSFPYLNLYKPVSRRGRLSCVSHIIRYLLVELRTNYDANLWVKLKSIQNNLWNSEQTADRVKPQSSVLTVCRPLS